MNEFGCIIEDYNPSELVTTQIELDVVDCILELDAITSNNSTTYTYEWYWNQSGFFNNDPSNYSALGTGASISVDPPIDDPCQFFFVHVKILLDGDVVSQRTIRLNGGLCAPFEPCNLIELETYSPLKISPIVDVDRIIVCDILGRPIYETTFASNSISISDHLPRGLFVVSTTYEDGTTDTSLLYISN